MRKSMLFFVVALILSLCVVSTIVYSSDTVYVWSNLSNSISHTQTNNTSENVQNTNTVSAPVVDLELESASAILIEQNTGKILYEHNSHEQLRPASVTKIMSILLIMEALDSGKITLDTPIPCSENAASMGGSQIWLDVRETLTVNEMLKAITIASANDCVVAMAEYLEGSEEAFVEKMNEKANALGMKDTCFKNCHGLDEDGHLTSSYDIALMSRELLIHHPTITQYTTIWMDTLRYGKSQLTNTNKLIRNYQGATGLKTGSTGLALYNLSASATRNDLSLIAVIMKAPSTQVRFSEAEKLLDYGFNHYTYEQFAKAGDVLNTLEVEKGVTSHVPVGFATDAGYLLEKTNSQEVTQVISLPDVVSAPVSKGQKIGEVRFELNGEVLCQSDIVALEEVKKMEPTSMLESLFFSWFRVLR